jgi:hypothetical protein
MSRFRPKSITTGSSVPSEKAPRARCSRRNRAPGARPALTTATSGARTARNLIPGRLADTCRC